MMLVALALLLAFQSVVVGAVEAGAQRRLAVAQYADATWRCRVLRGVEARRDCLARLGPPP